MARFVSCLPLISTKKMKKFYFLFVFSLFLGLTSTPVALAEEPTSLQNLIDTARNKITLIETLLQTVPTDPEYTIARNNFYLKVKNSLEKYIERTTEIKKTWDENSAQLSEQREKAEAAYKADPSPGNREIRSSMRKYYREQMKAIKKDLAEKYNQAQKSVFLLDGTITPIPHHYRSRIYFDWNVFEHSDYFPGMPSLSSVLFIGMGPPGLVMAGTLMAVDLLLLVSFTFKIKNYRVYLTDGINKSSSEVVTTDQLNAFLAFKSDKIFLDCPSSGECIMGLGKDIQDWFGFALTLNRLIDDCNLRLKPLSIKMKHLRKGTTLMQGTKASTVIEKSYSSGGH